MVINLTLAQVKEAGLKALNEGRLSCQGPTPSCSYRDPSRLPCVIGAALTDEQSVGLYGPIDDLVDRGTLSVPSEGLGDLEMLQYLHDKAAIAPDARRPAALARLREALEATQ